jgi:hypothetical protein
MRGGGNAPYVRIRHPETRRQKPDDCDCGDGAYFKDVDKTKEVDHKCEQFADTQCYPFDKFSRVIPVPAYTPGATFGGTIHGASQYGGDHIDGFEQSFSYYSQSWWNQSIGSYVGNNHRAWTNGNRHHCTGLSFEFYGYSEVETWWEYTVPAHPANAAGITLPVVQGGPRGLAITRGSIVAVSSVEPITLRAGASVGIALPSATTTIFIPIELVPAENATMYVGMYPSWMCDHDDIVCGFNFPYNTGKGDSGKSGAGGVSAPTATWVSWSAGATDWGSSIDYSEDDSVWWDGNLKWVGSGTDISLASVDGSKFIFATTDGDDEQFVLHMDGTSVYQPDDSDTDEQYTSPWDNENGVRLKMRFKSYTAGSVAAGTARAIYLGFADTRMLIRATVFLGDASHTTPSITLDADEQTDSADITYTQNTWHWLVIDTRHPDYVRAKVYPEGAEKPYWDVEIAVQDGADAPTNQDYLEIGMAAGISTPANDTIWVDSIYACGPADKDCQWVEEKLGDGDGSTQQFVTSMPMKTGSLWFFVDGFHVRTYTIDKNAGTFRANPIYWAATGAEIVARYIYSADTEA